MLKYILGIIKNLFNPAVSIFAKIDHLSKVDSRAKIYPGANIFNSSIASYSYVTKGCSIVYAEIGKYCSIGQKSTVGMGHHTLGWLSTSPIFTERSNATGHSWNNSKSKYPYKKVIIGNDVWIGREVMIMGGITIGDGAIIAAGSVVTKNIPCYAIVAGVPAKVIKYRFNEATITKLLNINWWNFSEQILKDNIPYFTGEDFEQFLDHMQSKKNE